MVTGKSMWEQENHRNISIMGFHKKEKMTLLVVLDVFRKNPRHTKSAINDGPLFVCYFRYICLLAINN